MYLDAYTLIAILGAPSALAATQGTSQGRNAYRLLSGDPKWPTDKEWSKLSNTVGGRLIRSVPLAQLCYGPALDVDACAEIQQRWVSTDLYPFSGPNGTCTLGNTPVYAIDVDSAATVAAGLKFALQKNIRLSVKKTGHDYAGRSSGPGPLELWMHNLKNISFFDYKNSGYTGRAAKVGAGVQFFEAYKATAEHGTRVLDGYCPTVGVAGGYVQGGGYKPLAASYGLVADNALEYEVVTVDAHSDGPTAGVSIVFAKTDDNKYWAAIGAFYKRLLFISTIPGFATFWGFDIQAFVLSVATLPGGGQSNMTTAWDPFIKELLNLGVPFISYNTSVHHTFYDHYQYYDFPPEIYATNNTIGGQLIPPTTVQNNLPGLLNAFRTIVSDGTVPAKRISGISLNVTHSRFGNTAGSNSVFPAWRDALYTLDIGSGFDADASPSELRQAQAKVNSWQALFEPLTPGGGAYMNEATFDAPNWKTNYFGVNYDRLLEVKKKYDPTFAL
ncbi:MAG: hypothetical protein Q9226_006792 [Calogaya cf. arnoldii]